MPLPGYPEALRVLRQDAGGDVHRVPATACAPVPSWDPVVYLADFGHRALFPLAEGVAGQEIAGTLAGRAFATGQPVSSHLDGSVRVWVPVVEQTTRTRVLGRPLRAVAMRWLRHLDQGPAHLDLGAYEEDGERAGTTYQVIWAPRNKVN